MRITSTLSLYLAKRYALNLFILLFALLAIIYLFDTVELIRRASKYDIPLSLILQMGILKLPEVGQTLFPFAILFSAMFTFWQLTRRYELIVVRASGFSIWQFLSPIIFVGILLGVLHMTVINPIGAVFISKFEDLERTYLKREKNQIAVFQEGLWLRQPVLIQAETSLLEAEIKPQNLVSGYVILHAKKIEQPDWVLKDITALYFKDNNEFLQRIDAKSATLDNQSWHMRDVIIHKKDNQKAKEQTYVLPTTLTANDIEESFSSPESMSFWKLPAYIKTLEQTGFDASRLKVHYHSLLSQPLMFTAMILLAAAVSMRPPRSKGTFLMIVAGIFIGFMIFFFSSFLQALGASQQIPVSLAAWSPALISFLLGLSVMMNMEDG
ncbi:MAG: LPS export ABC transporter permease LptG [Alphaproteobacteria bacterium]